MRKNSTEVKYNAENCHNIHRICKTKEYRNIPAAFLRHILSDPNLSDADKLVWLKLYELVAFDENWSVRVSRNDLGRALNKSGRTISRSTKSLRENGYIFTNEDDGEAAIYFVRFPERIVDEILTSSVNRKPAKVASIRRKASLKAAIPLDKNVQGPLPDLARGIAKSGIHTFKNNNLTKNNNIAQETKVVEVKKDSLAIVVDLDAVIQETKNKIEALDEQLHQANESIRDSCDGGDMALRRQLLEKFRAVSAKRDGFQSHLSDLQNRREKAVQDKVVQDALETNPTLSASLAGGRPVHDFQLHRLRRRLEEIGHRGGENIRLTNEIVHEIRFGSLKGGSQTGETLSVDHGLNIALKLVREGRWSKPTKFNSCMEKASYGIRN